MTPVFLARSKHIFAVAKFLQRNGEPVERLLRRGKLPSTCLEKPESLISMLALPVSKFKPDQPTRNARQQLESTAPAGLGKRDCRCLLALGHNASTKLQRL